MFPRSPGALGSVGRQWPENAVVKPLSVDMECAFKAFF
jgi:hypothetical protein